MKWTNSTFWLNSEWKQQNQWKTVFLNNSGIVDWTTSENWLGNLYSFQWTSDAKTEIIYVEKDFINRRLSLLWLIRFPHFRDWTVVKWCKSVYSPRLLRNIEEYSELYSKCNQCLSSDREKNKTIAEEDPIKWRGRNID